MESWMIVVIVAVALAVAAGVTWVVMRNRRTEDLRRRFGTEYDLALKTTGNRADAEAELASRTKRVERLDIRPLSAGDHDRFADRWRSTQASFVDNPAGAVSDAEKLVEEVMRTRGYPIGDFDQRAADISVDHPRFVENFRAARTLAVANQSGAARTEDLRQAMVHYRALFEDLLTTTGPKEVAVAR
jgi:hypothetical protein